MIRPILFRGGMYGDLVLGMMDKSCLIGTSHWKKEYVHSTCGGKNIKYTRTYMKKFFEFDNYQKNRYYNAFDKLEKKVFVLTHDTDYSMNFKDITTQIVCSDNSMLKHFAMRFEKLHRPKVIEESKKLIQNNGNFVEDYTKSLIVWQKAFVFPKRLDIKNIFEKNKFIKDLKSCFGHIDEYHASSVYDKHFTEMISSKQNLTV